MGFLDILRNKKDKFKLKKEEKVLQLDQKKKLDKSIVKPTLEVRNKEYSREQKNSAPETNMDMKKKIFPETKKSSAEESNEKKSLTLESSSQESYGNKKKNFQKPYYRGFIKTGIEGFDALMEHGIPKGSTILICGGAGTGKTIFGLQTLNYAAQKGEKCLYMSFEESEERLREHMRDFGWNPDKLEAEGSLLIKRFKPHDISKAVEALLMKAEGELLIDIEPLILPKGFKPDRIVIDSLTAIAAAFMGEERTYRIYIEQLFSFLESTNATSFLITETDQIPRGLLTKTGVEEFLADGVIIMYHIRKGDIREHGIEILKLRGANHIKKIVAFQINGGSGIEVFPQQKVFGGLGVVEGGNLS